MKSVITGAVFENSQLVKNSNHKHVRLGNFFDFSNPENLIICLLLQSEQTDPAYFCHAYRASIALSSELLVETIAELRPKN